MYYKFYRKQHRHLKAENRSKRPLPDPRGPVHPPQCIRVARRSHSLNVLLLERVIQSGEHLALQPEIVLKHYIIVKNLGTVVRLKTNSSCLLDCNSVLLLSNGHVIFSLSWFPHYLGLPGCWLVVLFTGAGYRSVDCADRVSWICGFVQTWGNSRTTHLTSKIHACLIMLFQIKCQCPLEITTNKLISPFSCGASKFITLNFKYRRFPNRGAGRVHSWNHVPRETAPAWNDCDTDIFDMPARRPVLKNAATTLELALVFCGHFHLSFISHLSSSDQQPYCPQNTWFSPLTYVFRKFD